MALPSTGPISMLQVRTELGLSGSISLGQAEVRELAGRPSGTISMSDLLGKSAIKWEGTLDNLPELTVWTRVSVGATAGMCTIVFRNSGIFTAHNGNSATNPITSGTLGNITNQRWDGNDEATRTGSEVRLTALGVTNHQGSTGTQTISFSGWNPTTAPGGYNSAICNIPQFFNENTYKFLIELRMAGNDSTTITKEFSLRITNRGA